MKRLLWIVILIADQVLDYIEKREALEGRVTRNDVDLAAKEGRGGWTGKLNGSDGIKSSLSEPHPFYSKGHDNE